MAGYHTTLVVASKFLQPQFNLLQMKRETFVTLVIDHFQSQGETDDDRLQEGSPE